MILVPRAAVTACCLYLWRDPEQATATRQKQQRGSRTLQRRGTGRSVARRNQRLNGRQESGTNSFHVRHQRHVLRCSPQLCNQIPETRICCPRPPGPVSPLCDTAFIKLVGPSRFPCVSAEFLAFPPLGILQCRRRMAASETDVAASQDG